MSLKGLVLSLWTVLPEGARGLRLPNGGTADYRSHLAIEGSAPPGIPEEYVVVHDAPQYNYESIYNWVLVHGKMKVKQGTFRMSPNNKDLLYAPDKTGKAIKVAGIEQVHTAASDDIVEDAPVSAETVSGSMTRQASGSGSGSRIAPLGSGDVNGSASQPLAAVPLTDPDHYQPASFPKKSPGCGEDLPEEAKRQLLDDIVGSVQNIRNRALADATNTAKTTSDEASKLVGENASRAISEVALREVIRKTCSKGLERAMSQHQCIRFGVQCATYLFHVA